ncbi:MAG: hypothetical protein OXG52_10215 [bacterium]|nr:hypothetical protein [bacterium]
MAEYSDPEPETVLLRRTGGSTSEGAYELLEALLSEGISTQSAVNVIAALEATFGSSDLGDLEEALLLAAFEESDEEIDGDASRVLSQIGNGLGVGPEGLGDYLRVVSDEVLERRIPPGVVVAGLSEHGYEYAAACELVEGRPCPIDVVVRLVTARQQGDYDQWSHVDCRLDRNIAHPGCVTFADCAAEYALVIAADDAFLEATQTANDLGHDLGTDGWQNWTAEAADSADQASEAHERCIDERYGVDIIEAYKALVLTR